MAKLKELAGAAAHQSSNGFNIVGLAVVFADNVAALKAAFLAAVDNLVAFLAVVDNFYRLHQAAAFAGAVAWGYVHMQGIKAKGAMVAVAAADKRQHFFAAMLANKSGIFFFSSHVIFP